MQAERESYSLSANDVNESRSLDVLAQHDVILLECLVLDGICLVTVTERGWFSFSSICFIRRIAVEFAISIKEG